MADMNPLIDIVNGDDADATDVQNNFQTIEAYINGTDLVRTDGTEVMTANLDMDGNTLANISGLDMNATKITDLADGTVDADAINLGQLEAAVPPGAWTSWTPQINQNGNRASTNNGSVYKKIGRTVHFMVNVTMSATGTAGSSVTISLPFTAANTNWSWFGCGSFYDLSSVTDYPAFGFLATTSTFWLRSSQFSSGAVIGSGTFTADPITTGDIIRFSGTYEAAS